MIYASSDLITYEEKSNLQNGSTKSILYQEVVNGFNTPAISKPFNRVTVWQIWPKYEYVPCHNFY